MSQRPSDAKTSRAHHRRRWGSRDQRVLALLPDQVFFLSNGEKALMTVKEVEKDETESGGFDVQR